jgi:hypothetical protein
MAHAARAVPMICRRIAITPSLALISRDRFADLERCRGQPQSNCDKIMQGDLEPRTPIQGYALLASRMLANYGRVAIVLPLPA